MANSWDQLRTAGAEARARLIAAAAKEWGVDAGTITIDKGVVKAASGKSATFGELAGLAQQVEVRRAVQAEGAGRLEADRHQQAAEGRHAAEDQRHGDVHHRREDAEHADVPRGASVALRRQGEIVRCGTGARRAGRQGSVRSFAGRRCSGRRLLGGEEGPRRAQDHLGRERHRSRAAAIRSSRNTSTLPASRGRSLATTATPTRRLAGAAKVIEATYVFPYLAHAPMEPNNCVIHRTDDGGVELNFGSQIQTIDQGVAAAVLGLKPEQVKIKYAARRRQLRPPRDARGRHGGGGRGGPEGRAAQRADQGAVDARGRHQGRPLPADLRAPLARRHRRARQHRRLGPGDRRPVVHEGLAVRGRHGEERRRPDDGRGRQHAALSDPQPARVGAHRPRSACRRCGGARSARRTRRSRPRRSSISWPMRPASIRLPSGASC